MKNQPTPELEAENAAYVWVRECLKEHALEIAKGREYLSDKAWEEIVWTFERLKIAQERHQKLEKARLGK